MLLPWQLKEACGEGKDADGSTHCKLPSGGRGGVAGSR